MTEKKFSIKDLEIDGCFLLFPKIYSDERGSFHEIFNKKFYDDFFKKKYKFVQDNISVSKKNVLRGLHFQAKNPQGKLLSVMKGSILDVIVDLRKNSKTFKKHIKIILNYKDKTSLWLTPGIAHGFCVLSKEALVNYKVTKYYNPKDEYTIRWNDKDLNIDWPIKKPILSKKDKNFSISFSRALNYL